MVVRLVATFFTVARILATFHHFALIFSSISCISLHLAAYPLLFPFRVPLLGLAQEL